MSDRKKEIVVLAGLVLVGLALRAWLIPHRWINPDEGAHLMDGQLMLDGLVPQVDYDSRQPLYVYLTGLAVWTFGSDLFVLRYFPVIVTLALGVTVHLIGRELLHWKAGLLAAGLVLLLPFGVLETTLTKMGPLAMLSSAVAVYWLVSARTRSSRGSRRIFVAGLCAGAAFYIRPSTIAVLAALLLILVMRGGGWRRVLKRSGLLILGVATVSIAASACYARHLPLSEALFGQILNPFTFVADNVESAATALLGGANGASGDFARTDRLGAGRSIGNILESAWVNVVLLVGAGLSGLLAARRWLLRQRGPGIDRYTVPALWFGCVALAYSFWTVKRGFYPAYFLEMLPPLALLTSAAVSWCWERMPRTRTWRSHLLGLAAAAAVFGAVHWIAGTRQISRSLYLLISAGVLGLHYLPNSSLLEVVGERRRAISALAAVILSAVIVVVGPTLPTLWSAAFYLLGIGSIIALLVSAVRGVVRWTASSGVAFGAFALLSAGLFLSLSESAIRLDRRYQGVWSPETLVRASSLLDRHTDPDDRVASGGVIWEFQAGRRPFANLSHPLALNAGTAPERSEQLRRALRLNPPEAVVLDGYTEITYLRAFPDMAELWNRKTGTMRHLATLEGSREPVRIYVDRDPSPAGAGDP